MPELKRTFSKAKMNKDMDERLVPKGEYRDALNIEIATSEGSDVGTAQSLLGNTLQNTMNSNNGVYFSADDVTSTATCVGSIAAPDRDAVYYFVSNGDLNNSTGYPTIRKDFIIEYNTVSQDLKYVFVDIFEVNTSPNANVNGSSVVAVELGAGNTTNITGIREGMYVTGTFTNASGSSQTILGQTVANGATYTVTKNDNVRVTGQSYTGNRTYTLSETLYLADADTITFEADRVLEFNRNVVITGINILDDFIFWTDNVHEPKKINIERSILGTGGTTQDLIAGNGNFTFDGSTPYFHTRLVLDKEATHQVLSTVTVSGGDTLQVAITQNTSGDVAPIYVDLSHVTVIRKAPTQPLELDMYRTSVARVRNNGDENPPYATQTGQSYMQSGNTPYDVGDQIPVSFDQEVDFRVGDIILITYQEDVYTNDSFDDYQIRAEVVDSQVIGPNVLFSTGFTIKILSIDESLAPLTDWHVRLEDKDPLFKFKFPRFSYRYRYQDGEYSPFAPFSQIAFLPDMFEYKPKKGHNIGMVNQLRGLVLKYYKHRDYQYSSTDYPIFPQDVVEIDILYKETNNPAVYTVKTIKKSDGAPLWPSYTTTEDGATRAEFEITTDMIHNVVPSNQLIRPYDNVPKKALAQEISASRLIYGNYTQGYDVKNDPLIRVGIDHQDIAFSTNVPTDGLKYALPSVKTMRKYQVGVVFSDRYGRETPVITSKNASINVPKKFSENFNRLVCNLDKKNGSVPSWAEYMSWYVKEITTEYYTLAMDRWYDAADGNIWISFPSADRNKLSVEDYLILKKEHGKDKAVKEKARYKILDIDNEAPDWIKTKRQSLGVVNNPPFPQGIIGNTNEGFPLQGTRHIDMPLTTFENVYGTLEEIRNLENTSIVIAGGHQEVSGVGRAEYIVETYTLQGDDTVRLSIEGFFGDEISFTTLNGTFPTHVNNLTFELVKRTAAPRPEFNGRFFVKIFKDRALEKYILRYEEAVNYSINESIGLRYINNNAYSNLPAPTADNPTPSIPTDLKYAAMFDSDVSSVTASFAPSYGLADRSQHPTEAFHISNTLGAYLWGNGIAAHNVYRESVKDNPMLSLNYGAFQHDQNFDSASQFWEYVAESTDAFIDCCTAYTLTGERWDAGVGHPEWPEINTTEQINSYGHSDSPGSRYQPNFPAWGSSDSPPIQEGVNYIHYSFWGSRDGLDMPSQVNPFSNNNSPVANSAIGNALWDNPSTIDNLYLRNRGNPSRGIWNNGRCMDISWSGIRGGYWDGPNNGNSSPPPLTVQDADSNEAGQNQFRDKMELLMNPGCKFRFRDDPDATVYTVENNTYPGYPENSGTGSETDAENLRPFNASVGGTSYDYGVWGIRNYVEGVQYDVSFFTGDFKDACRELSNERCLRQRWTVWVTPPIGSGPSGYNPIRGTVNENPYLLDGETSNPRFRRALHHDFTNSTQIDILNEDTAIYKQGTFTEEPGIWETEPKETVDLDLYYQASGLIPLHITHENNEELIPIGSTFRIHSQTPESTASTFHTVTKVEDNKITFTPATHVSDTFLQLEEGDTVKFTKRNFYTFELVADEATGLNNTTLHLKGKKGVVTPLDQRVYTQLHYLDWNNCWAFGNGVESDRIRDDFNGTQMDNGVKVSSTTLSAIEEETRKHGMIYSGIYNSTSGVNDTNQFIAGENITKDLNPVHGSIQALLNRNTRLIMFCEDKVLRADTNKDLIFNADGNSQLVASNKVIGSTVPYKGKYGIATNPESLAATPYAVYFADAMRGAVLRLTNEGIVNVSDFNMKDYFADIFSSYVDRVIGTYDDRKKEYNISISRAYESGDSPFNQVTVSYSDKAKGWTSFKSFYPESGVSINNQYYTFSRGEIYRHHSNDERNNFYGVAAASQTSNTILPFDTSNATTGDSSITVLFNDRPEEVKSYMTINYEGSENRIQEFDTQVANFYNNNYESNDGLVSTSVTDGEYYNLDAQAGWYVDNITTNLQATENIFFKNKEGKYFAYPKGSTTGFESVTVSSGSSVPSINEVALNKEAKDFTVQGLGNANILHSDSNAKPTIFINVQNNVSNTYKKDGGSSGSEYDATSDSNSWRTDPSVFSTWYGLDDTVIPANQSVDLTITPVLAGNIYSGIPVSASNFKIGGATYNSGTNTWSGGNMDSPIAGVQFTDNGVAGESSNTVNVKCLLNTAYTTDGNQTVYIDIDQVVVDEGRRRSAGIKTVYQIYGSEVQTDPTVANGRVFDLTDITESGFQSGSNPPANPLLGPLDQVVPTSIINSHIANNLDPLITTPQEIAKIRFEATSPYYYLAGQQPYVDFEIPSGSPLEPYYSYEVTDHVYTTFTGIDGSFLTDFTVRIFFTIPQDPELWNDLSNIQYLSHIANIVYTPLLGPTEPNHIKSVTYSKSCPSEGGEKEIKVYGEQDTTYKVCVEKKQSRTSSNTVATGGYYNFENHSFQDDKYDVVQKIKKGGVNSHYLCLPKSTSDVRYDITIVPVNSPSGGTATVASGVPTVPGDATLTQYGERTLTLTPVSDSSSYDTMPTQAISRPVQIPRYSYNESYGKSVNITGGTAGLSTTELSLDIPSEDIRTGMLVYDPFGSSTIPLQTTITRIVDEVVTLSNSVTVADGTTLRFTENNGTLTPFSLTVQPAAGKTISLKSDKSFTNSINARSSFAFSVTTSGSSTTLRTNKSPRGVVAGMKLYGKDIVSTTLDEYGPFLTVQSVGLSASTIIVDQAQNLSTSTEVSAQHIKPDSSSEYSAGTNEDYASSTFNKVIPKHVQAKIEDGNLIVEGYIQIKKIGIDTPINIHIDDFASIN